jgi:hypothetical protein
MMTGMPRRYAHPTTWKLAVMHSIPLSAAT